MSAWIWVAQPDEMAPGEFRVVFDGDTAIAIFNIDGEFHAVEDVCTHDGGDLAGGCVEGFAVECPRHGARFDVRSGAVLTPPAVVPIAVMPVRVDREGVWTRDPRNDQPLQRGP